MDEAPLISQSVDEAPIYHDDHLHDDHDVTMTAIEPVDGHGAGSESEQNSKAQSGTRSEEKWVDRNREHFACQIENDGQSVNRNAKMSGIFVAMSSIYECLGTPWKGMSYKKVGGFISKYPTAIRPETVEADIRCLRKQKGFSAKFGAKVLEIVRTGSLRKYEEMRAMPQIKVIQLFSNIFGVGPKTARNWYNLGLRTLDDLQSGKGGVTLDRRQKLGVKYFDDLYNQDASTERIYWFIFVNREA